ncbi:hypothetical protein C8J41_10518 [Sphingomonas sp. PP-CC-3G-468]|nr:hypothetical protein C8J39_3306 [Sphingomonas sp. PP-CC-1A-547]TCM06171.1 hypothetical protein C8J41_10518 [Sphingomonas sp. PP-CC-3G-468]
MHVRTPKRAWTLWIVGIALACAPIPLIMYHSHLYYAEGGTSVDGPAMLLMSVIMTSSGWGAIWLLILAPYLVGYRGAGALTLGVGATFSSILLSTIAFGLTGLFLWLACAQVEFWKLSRIPFTAHLIGCAVYFQYLRAAVVNRSLRVGSR